MAQLEKCDGGCGTISPDPTTRLYTHFLTVEAKREHGGYVREKAIYCRECAHRVLAAMAPLDKPLPPLKPLPQRPLISTAGIFWLCVGVAVVFVIQHSVS